VVLFQSKKPLIPGEFATVAITGAEEYDVTGYAVV